MIATHDRLLVRVNLKQKDEIKVGGMTLKLAHEFEKNYRERSPVLAEVVQGNKQIRNGSIIVCHHNHFNYPSPYFLQDDLYSIPFKKTIFGVFDSEGNMSPVCGNIFCEYMYAASEFLLPEESRKPLISQYKVVDPGDSGFVKGEIIFTRPHAGYQIVYHWSQLEKRVVKVDKEQICGFLVS